MDSEKNYVFVEGSWVQFVGLKNSYELNGKIGQVGAPISHKEGRIVVAIHDRLRFDQNVNYLCTRRYLKNPQSKLFKPENLTPIPDTELTSLVRISCDGERSQHPEIFEEIKFPRLHPIFFQPSNCYIPEKVGIPLILTKIEVPHNYIQDRGWMVNQRLVFLKARVESGIADFDDMDFVGPGYVCRPGGAQNYTVKEALAMHDYLYHLMGRYGDPDIFKGPRDITQEDYQEFVACLLESQKEYEDEDQNEDN